MPCRPEGAHCPGPSDDLTVAMRPGSLPRGCAALLPQYARAVVNSLPLHTKTQPPRVNGLHYGFLLSLELKRVLPIRPNAKKKVELEGPDRVASRATGSLFGEERAGRGAVQERAVWVLLMEAAAARRRQGQLPAQSWWGEGSPPWAGRVEGRGPPRGCSAANPRH